MALLLVAPTPRRDIILATTTSVRDAGLLDSILAGFQRSSGWEVRVLAVGSGQAMELGRRGEADILILHDPAGEEAFVREGFGIDRSPLMHNEFVLVGPPGDPAGIRGLRSAVDALAAIARAGARFVSRGDRSGTNVKEDTIWARAGRKPARPWYREAGQGMSATLQIANELQAYTLTDIGTYLSHRSPLQLEIMVEGDSLLFNPYHVLLVNPEKFARLNSQGARALHDHLLEPETQGAIARFRRAELGRSIFLPAVPVGTAVGKGERADTLALLSSPLLACYFYS